MESQLVLFNVQNGESYLHKYELVAKGLPVRCKIHGVHSEWRVSGKHSVGCTLCHRITKKDPISRKRRNEYMKRWTKKNPTLRRQYKLKAQFGLSLTEYDSILTQQHGVCAICEQPEFISILGHTPVLRVDHDHITGKIRGLLCSNCNTALGLFKDSRLSLNRALNYLNGAH